MAKIKIQTGDEGYRIVVDGKESDVVEYGEPAILEVGGETYLALCDLDGQDDVVSLIEGGWVLCGKFAEVSEDNDIEDVDFEEDGGEEEEGDEEESEEGGEGEDA